MAGNTLEAVLLDFHGTLAQVEPITESVTRAALDAGLDLDPIRVTALADALATGGWVGGANPPRIRPHFAAAWANRFLSQDDEREAFTELAAQVCADNPKLAFDGLPEALYGRLVAPDGWRAYADTVGVLEALRARGIKTAVLSNIGFDVRAVAKHLGFDELVDTWLLSFELGVCKPEAAFFRHACTLLDVEPENALMVGDTSADAGAVAVGCRTLLLPASEPGSEHGLDAVLRLLDTA